jgi:hypothetical protein
MTHIGDQAIIVRDRFLFGTGYVDEETGVRFDVYSPASHPQQWRTYLEGAENIYHQRGLADGSAWRALENGDGVGLFFVATNESGEAIAGIRFHGPLRSIDEAATLTEMASSSEIEDIRAVIASRLDDGIIEMKGMWALGKSVTGVALSDALVRTHLVAMQWLGAAYVYNTSAERQIELGRRCGVATIWDVPVFYPDERYKTVAMTFEYEATLDLCQPSHRVAHLSDLAQLELASAVRGQSPDSLSS